MYSFTHINKAAEIYIVVAIFHIEAERNGCLKAIGRQIHVLEWKPLRFDSNVIKLFSTVSNSQWVDICSNNYLAPNRQHVTIETKEDVAFWYIHYHIHHGQKVCFQCISPLISKRLMRDHSRFFVLLLYSFVTSWGWRQWRRQWLG